MRFLNFITLTIFLLFFSCQEKSGSYIGGALTESSRLIKKSKIENENQQLMKTIESEISLAAPKVNVRVAPYNFIVSSEENDIVVNTKIVGLEKITSKQLETSANVGFVYLSFSTQNSLTSGFYTVRASMRANENSGIVYLVDKNNQIAAKYKGAITRVQNIRQSPLITSNISLETSATAKKRPRICITIEWGNKFVKICF